MFKVSPIYILSSSSHELTSRGPALAIVAISICWLKLQLFMQSSISFRFFISLEFKLAQYTTVEMAIACVHGALEARVSDDLSEAQKSSLLDLLRLCETTARPETLAT